MDIYHKFTLIPSTLTGLNRGITLPSSMKALVVASNIGGNVNLDLFTYGATGGVTQTNRINISAGTHLIPMKLWGISSGSSASLNYFVAY